MQIEATIVKDSTTEVGKRITTFELCYPRFIHGELMTHRVFSRNAMSSRAIPVKKVLAQVWSDPAMPVHWGANQAGMQAKSQLKGWRKALARGLWRGAGKVACVFAWGLMKLGLHKQVANRILEPWQWMRTLVTATEWDNFYELRNHEDAQPEFRVLAIRMRTEMDISVPQVLLVGEWHLPYVESKQAGKDLLNCKISAARCARVSYLTHDGKNPDEGKDLVLFVRLAGSRPLHASPLEHQASPGDVNWGNFVGWTQYRKLWEMKV